MFRMILRFCMSVYFSNFTCPLQIFGPRYDLGGGKCVPPPK